MGQQRPEFNPWAGFQTPQNQRQPARPAGFSTFQRPGFPASPLPPNGNTARPPVNGRHRLPSTPATFPSAPQRMGPQTLPPASAVSQSPTGRNIPPQAPDVYQRQQSPASTIPAAMTGDSQTAMPGLGSQDGVQESSEPFSPMNMIAPGGPIGFIGGGLAGIGIAQGVNWLFKGEKLHRGIANLDALPVVSHISQFIDNRITGSLDRLKPGRREVADTLLKRLPAEEVEKQMVQRILHNLKNRFPGAVTHIDTHLGGVTKLNELTNLLSGKQRLSTGKTFAQAAGIQLTRKDRLHQQVFDLFRRVGNINPKNERLNKIFAFIGKPREVQPRKLKGAIKFSKGQKQIIHAYEDQAKVLKELKTLAKGGRETGPIGRALLSGTNYLKRIMGGSALLEASSEIGLVNSLKTNAGRFFGPFLAGSMMLGMAYGEARKVKDGSLKDKVGAFFHNFLGVGLGAFIGWEVTRGPARMIVEKLLGRFGLRGVLMFSGAGLAAELLAMFVLAIPFQKAGEKIAHAVFGKPQHEIEEENKAKGVLPRKQANMNIPTHSTPGETMLDRRIHAPGAVNTTNQPGTISVNQTGPVSEVPVDLIRGNPAASAQEALSNEILGGFSDGWDDSMLIPRGLDPYEEGAR